MRLSLVILLIISGQSDATALRSSIHQLASTNFSNLQAVVAELKEIDDNGCNALHHAATLGDVTLFKFLLDIGIIANTTDKDGLRPN